MGNESKKKHILEKFFNFSKAFILHAKIPHSTHTLAPALPSPFPSPFPFAYPFPFPIPTDIGICSRYAAGSGVLHAATQLAMKWKTKASIS